MVDHVSSDLSITVEGPRRHLGWGLNVRNNASIAGKGLMVMPTEMTIIMVIFASWKQ